MDTAGVWIVGSGLDNGMLWYSTVIAAALVT